MRLRELIRCLPSYHLLGEDSVDVSGIAYDSRRVRAGDLFCAVVGRRHDGHDFVHEACSRGAAALLVQRPVRSSVPQVVVPSVREAMGPVASAFWGYPSHQMEVVGVTGTNGKGTVTWLVRAALEAAGVRCGVVGTLGAWLGSGWEPLERTTPEAADLHALLARMVQGGMRAAAVEVASHALDQERVGGVRFRVAAFTNLTQDHLDFHGTWEAYREAKAKLFRRVEPDGLSVVNRDDPHGAYMASCSRAAVLTYGVRGQADVRARSVRVGPEGCTFEVVAPAGRAEVRLHLVGRFNVYNALCALAVASYLGVPLQQAASGLASVRGIPGRFERVHCGQPFTVVVDYAHTPDGLANVLAAAREITRGRVIVVFGCGGERDRAKRPQMGQVAARLADHVVVTSDNPRGEDPLAIVEEVVQGVRRAGGLSTYEVEPDRREAIRKAVRAARAGDAVLICGKGHETTQVFKDRAVPFDDREEARRALRELGWDSEVS
ncbi:MAG: UDP-N-acetylmuramoyl-L-alanyl-D-glutamate--2,6-diaminopimelate ligase [Armatimonadota bacterium]|nr:UDP-N-acetylmuramoyl-L-alanyl-D-glutamate--2,6-diaminopimelate ligase [Armatimonadota bacterium]MDW8156916.1 UDP-N-acetylmuramoyl-L-alanyl-D-glutamate--2,6-diaminopimelate ligase [Armatimonadota bacterium]